MNDTTHLPYDLRSFVERELESGEGIEWMAQPIPRRFALKTLPIVLFGIPWTAFAIFWICGASGFKVPDFTKGGFSFFPLFGVPFVLIGLGMLSAPYWALRSARKTVYVITDRRAIVIGGGWRMNVRSFRPDRLRDLSRKEARDGTGDVIIERQFYRDSDGDRRTNESGFYGIQNVKEVERILNALAAKGNPP